MNKLIFSFCLVFLLHGLSPAKAEESFFTLPPEEFFRMDRVQQPIDLSHIDAMLLSAAIFHETNKRRKGSGLDILGYRPQLYKAADMHARSMAKGGHLSHDNPDDPRRRTPWDRVKLVGLHPSFVAENVASHFGIQYESGSPFFIADAKGKVQFSRTPGGQPIPNHTYTTFAQTLLDQWMASPGHRENILSKQARLLGSAAVRRDPESHRAMDKFFCVQVFAAL